MKSSKSSIFLLLFMTVCVPSCRNDGGMEDIISGTDIKIVVGSYVGKNLKKNEYLYDGDVLLEYYVNGNYIGDGRFGARKMVDYLSQIKQGGSIEIQNPLATFLGSPSRGPGLRDEDYRYPWVRDLSLRARAVSEINRIRGWSDSTKSSFLD